MIKQQTVSLIYVLSLIVPVYAKMSLEDIEAKPMVDKVHLGTVHQKNSAESNNSFFEDSFSQAVGIGVLNWIPSNESLFKNGKGGGIAYAMEYKSQYGAEVSYERIETESKSTPELASGKVTIQPISITIQYFPLKSPNIRPFFLVGGAYYLFNLTTDDSEKQFWKLFGYNFNQKLENNFGYHYGAGLKLFLFPQKLDITVTYRITEISTTAEKTFDDLLFGGTYILNSDVDLGAKIAEAQISYHF